MAASPIADAEGMLVESFPSSEGIDTASAAFARASPTLARTGTAPIIRSRVCWTSSVGISERYVVGVRTATVEKR
jgi:hypothetical protein